MKNPVAKPLQLQMQLVPLRLGQQAVQRAVRARAGAEAAGRGVARAGQRLRPGAHHPHRWGAASGWLGRWLRDVDVVILLLLFVDADAYHLRC
jgi:hypothetical protein